MTRPPSHWWLPRSLFQLKYYRWNSNARERRRDGGRRGRGASKEKNKFDQSEGGGYRFGYGFRKRRRILFLRKPDKRPFARIYIFAHASSAYAHIYTRRRCARTRACVNAPTKKERDGKVTNISSHYPHIEFLLFTHININIYVMEKTKIKKDTRDVDGRKSSRCNFHECTFSAKHLSPRERERTKLYKRWYWKLIWEKYVDPNIRRSAPRYQ